MSLDYFATQSGSYTAEVTRRALLSWAARTSANSPGIIAGGLLSASDLTVSAPASGMSVNIGAGEALIGGTEGGAQGGYYIRNSATYSASVAAANATNPRIDAVVATMADSGYTQPSDVGATTNGPVLAVVTGTPTASASLTNLLGAPAIPASSLLLAYLLVPAGATNIVSGDISNRAKVVGLQSGPRSRVLTTTAGTNYTTTSSTFAAVDGTNLSATITCTGAPIKATFVGSGSTSSGQDTAIGIAMDGSINSSGTTLIGGLANAIPFCSVAVFTPAAGTHTFAPYWAVTSGGTGTIYNTAVVLGTNEIPVFILESLGPSSSTL